MRKTSLGRELGNIISEEIPEMIHQDFVDELTSQAVDKNELFQRIKNEVIDFLQTLNNNGYQNLIKYNPNGTVEEKKKRLEDITDLIYAKFFEIQNLINLYCGQRVVMTYVHVDESGHREIRVFDNTVDLLTVKEGSFYGNPFYKLGYDVSQKYSILKNGLPEKNNQNLDNTAKEVEERYSKYRKQVLWKINKNWKGYRLTSKGPINEAYVNMYIHEIKLKGSLEKQIDTFMLSKHGAIAADNTKGYLIGDVRKNGIQYAVKGAFGSPQGYKQIIKEFEKLVAEDFSKSSFRNFITKFTKDELNKSYKPHIKELTGESIDKVFADFPELLGK